MAGGGIKSNAWLNMWTKPKETIREIVAFNPDHRFLFLCGIYGFPLLLNMAQSISLGEVWSFPLILVSALVLAIFGGWVGISLVSFFLFWPGKWLGGKASFKQVRAAVAWSNLPSFVNGLTWIALMAVFQKGLFFSSFFETPFQGGLLALVMVAYLIQFVMGIWSFFLQLFSLSEVQGFSSWKAFFNILIPFVIVTLVLWLFDKAMMGMQAVNG